VRVLAQNSFTHLDPQAEAAQQNRHSSMAKDNAVLGDILRQQKLAVGPFDEVHTVEISGDVSSGRRKNCGFTDMTTKLKSQTRALCQTSHLQRANDSAALRKAQIEVLAGARGNQRASIRERDE
jgi:hypothetical protein